MPLFYQQDINETTRLGVWKIEEDASFFLKEVPVHRSITHPYKQLQHLAGRFILKYLYPDFPYELIRIADTKKPFLHNAQYHFSISHSGEYAAALVSTNKRVGVDVELYSDKVMKVLHKFLTPPEMVLMLKHETADYVKETLFWSAKESIFKWHGNGGVDFREQIHIQSLRYLDAAEEPCLACTFTGEPKADLDLHFRLFHDVCLSWVSSDHTA